MGKNKEYDGSTPLKTAKQEQFVKEYIIDLNATRAAKDAGYSEKTANRIASVMLTKVDIQKRIEFLKTQNIKRVRNDSELELTADRVLEEVARLAFSNINHFVTITDDGYAHIDMAKATEAQMAALAGIETIELPPVTLMGTDGEPLKRETLKVKIKLWDKSKNLENLMKHFGLIKERVEVEGLDKMIENLHKGRERVKNYRNKNRDV